MIESGGHRTHSQTLSKGSSDRKSTRPNSSHSQISYAVFCLKKKNTLRAGERGPSVLEDFHFREKIFHFDHERIPERVVHARGYGAHGYFAHYEPLTHIPQADTEPHHLQCGFRSSIAPTQPRRRGRARDRPRKTAQAAPACAAVRRALKCTRRSPATPPPRPLVPHPRPGLPPVRARAAADR